MRLGYGDRECGSDGETGVLSLSPYPIRRLGWGNGSADVELGRGGGECDSDVGIGNATRM